MQTDAFPRFLSRNACFAFAFLLFSFPDRTVYSKRIQWNVPRLDLEEGHRLEAVCRANVDASYLRLDLKRQHEQDVELVPLGLSFSDGYLSLGAVTLQDDGLQFVCSHEDTSDTLTLNVRPSSTPLSASSFASAPLFSPASFCHSIMINIYLFVQVIIEMVHAVTSVSLYNPEMNKVIKLVEISTYNVQCKEVSIVPMNIDTRRTELNWTTVGDSIYRCPPRLTSILFQMSKFSQVVYWLFAEHKQTTLDDISTIDFLSECTTSLFCCQM